VGIDPFEPQYKASLEEGIKNFDIAFTLPPKTTG